LLAVSWSRGDESRVRSQESGVRGQ
jgi:hypothetical protein